jgi:hypothetical protein
MASKKETPGWTIKNLDTGKFLIPPYPIGDEGVRVDVGGVISEQERFGFQDPIIQWTRGKTRVITFTTVLYAEDSTESILSKLSEFEKLSIKDESLGRPPVCIFTYGMALSETVLIESVDQEIAPLRSDFEPRLVTLSISIKRYKPFSQTQIDPTKPSKESYFLVVKASEASYEAIAKHYYGQPIYGDRLRKRIASASGENLDREAMALAPIVGSKIKIPSRSIILKEVVEPTFHAFDLEDETVLDSFLTLLERRSRKMAVL